MNTLNHLKKHSHAITFVNSPKGKFIWPKNAKTGGTSIQHSIEKKFNDVLHDTERQVDFFNTLTEDSLNDFFKFTFIRNPWDRVVSIYNIFGRKFNANFDVFVSDILPKYACEMSVESFDKLSPKENSLHRHSLPQHLYFFNDGEIYVDFVGRFEHIELDWTYISEKLGINDKIPHLNSNKGNKLDYRSFYSENSITAVNNIYKKDIAILEYRFNK